MKTPFPKYERRTYQMYTYDLWSDGDGGVMVNNTFQGRKVTLRAKKYVYIRPNGNPLVYYHLTNTQLNRAVGARGATWDGEEDATLYAIGRNGNPLCELRRVWDE